MNFLFKGSGDTIIDEGVYSKGRMMRCAGSSKYGAAGTHLYLSNGWVRVTELCPAVIMSNQYTTLQLPSSFRRDAENRQLSNGVLS
jgi:hypothetical protein